MKVKRIKNVGNFVEVATDTILSFADRSGTREIEVRCVGPCVVWLQPVGGDKMLLDVVDRSEVLQFAYPGEFDVTFDPSGPCFYRTAEMPLVKAAPVGKVYTRMEQPGLHIDELGVVLHRQAVLSRIATGRESVARDAHTRNLERQLAELSEAVKRLTPPAAPEAPLPEVQGA